ncbi:hypothetical protein BC938DRAFT_479598 [Jimgerdemannia flammicorona]|uniref:Uncharacterized protein n=1 Tax=Jimgerdemannia flammicorona TaxID=994334 RepID=A0A433QXV1_9FUNG|nr:hypothetical protein BC938DRAFT_479598 [Jimgerdemannia flammicorona]
MTQCFTSIPAKLGFGEEDGPMREPEKENAKIKAFSFPVPAKFYDCYGLLVVKATWKDKRHPKGVSMKWGLAYTVRSHNCSKRTMCVSQPQRVTNQPHRHESQILFRFYKNWAID